MAVATERTVNNARDTGRTFPSSALAPKMMQEDEGVILEKLVGPAANATVVLSRPALAVKHVTSYTTATGVWSTGGAPVKKPVPQAPGDFTVLLEDSANGGKCSLKEAAGANYSAETWVVYYQPKSAEGTIGGSTVS